MMPTALDRQRSLSDSELAESKASPLNPTTVKVSMTTTETKQSDGDDDNGIAACCLFLAFVVIATALFLLVIFWPSIDSQKAEPSKVVRIKFKLTIALPVGFPLERSGEKTAPTVVNQSVEVNDEKCIKIEVKSVAHALRLGRSSQPARGTLSLTSLQTSKLAGMRPCTFIHDFE